MFYRHLIPLGLVATTVIIISTPQVDASSQARAIQPRDVAAIAKKTVVRIESSDGGFGSGVIIGRARSSNKNIYTILTAAHVVSELNNNYRIVTPIVSNNLGEKKRERINIDLSQNIKILPKVDLALVSFESSYNFSVGTIGNSEDLEEGTPVYVAGFPQPGQAIKRIAFQFTGGMISSRLDESESDPKEQNNGYDLSYTSVTRAGMSGGPVLDVAGRIIAIHGQADRNSQSPAEEATGGVTSSEKTGFNLGIPIGTFLKLQPQSLTTMGMRIDNSPIDYQLEDGSLMMGTNNRKFLRRYRTRSAAAPIFDVTKVNEQTSD
jgi:S1-C subfamily serine protease